MSGERYLQIGEVAEQLGLTPRTLRYYEEIGLLAPPSRMEGGFRLYSAADIVRLENIVQLKRLLGFSLAEIKQVVDGRLRQVAEMRDRFDERSLRVRERLEQIEAELQVVLVNTSS